MKPLRPRSENQPCPGAVQLSEIVEVGFPYFLYDILTGFYKSGYVIGMPDEVSDHSRMVVWEHHPFIKHALYKAHRNPVNLGLISDDDGWHAYRFCVSDNVPEKWRSFIKWLRSRRDDPVAQAASRQLGLDRDSVDDDELDGLLDDLLYGKKTFDD